MNIAVPAGAVAEPDTLPLPEVRPRLLLVDDQPINIQVIYQAVVQDYQVFIATTGEQALQLCASKHPDLVLLDVEMPGMDGYEVCRRLKADPATREIPVIFVTAHNDEASETLGLDLGAVDFISKPINPKVVRARVRTQLTVKAQSDLLRQWVYIDGLTGVRNRRYFDERLAEEWGRSQRENTPLSLVLVDVDLFKRFNDHYGHQAGDVCLRRVASALKASLSRQGDQLARYGGEEFVCLLPNTGLEGAASVAQIVREKVADLAIGHADSTVAAFVTISLGVCSSPGRTKHSALDLLRGADAQLYRAKSLGRNQVCAQLLPETTG